LHKGFRKLIQRHIDDLIEHYKGEVKINGATAMVVDSFAKYIEKTIALTKLSAKLKDLDRHKMLGVITVATLSFRPLILVGGEQSKVRKEAHYANEHLSMTLCEEMLFLYMRKQFCEYKDISSNFVSRVTEYLRNNYTKPQNKKDKNNVGSCMQNALTQVKLTRIPDTTSGSLPKGYLGTLLLVSHIYYYFELYNWSNWVFVPDSGENLLDFLGNSD